MRVGDVYYAFCSLLIGSPKNKYMAVICSDAPIRIALINTENSAQALNNPAFGASQVLVRQANHQFLDYDSWLDCSRLISGDTLGLDALPPIGRLTDDILRLAIGALQSSPTLPPKQQRRCSEAISAELPATS